MSLGAKLLALISFSQSLYSKWLFKRLLAGAAVLAILALVTLILVCALLASIVYTLYIALIGNGLDPISACLIVTATLMLATIALAVATYRYATSLRKMPKDILKKSPLASRITETVDAFLEGFLKEDEPLAK